MSILFHKGPQPRKGTDKIMTSTSASAANSSKAFKAAEIALLIGLALFLASGALALQAGDQLAEKVVRLHVLANSDSEEDQTLKLQVRDKILERAETLLEQSADRREAEGLLRGQLLELEKIAAEEIRAHGYDYAVDVRLENAAFPTREYDGFTLPAGNYLALRVVIGAGEGKNWWCVVFPPLCTAASGSVPETALAAGLTEEQVGLITEDGQGYVLKSKAVEWWQQLRAAMEG